MKNPAPAATAALIALFAAFAVLVTLSIFPDLPTWALVISGGLLGSTLAAFAMFEGRS